MSTKRLIFIPSIPKTFPCPAIILSSLHEVVKFTYFETLTHNTIPLLIFAFSSSGLSAIIPNGEITGPS